MDPICRQTNQQRRKHDLLGGGKYDAFLLTSSWKMTESSQNKILNLWESADFCFVMIHWVLQRQSVTQGTLCPHNPWTLQSVSPAIKHYLSSLLTSLLTSGPAADCFACSKSNAAIGSRHIGYGRGIIGFLNTLRSFLMTLGRPAMASFVAWRKKESLKVRVNLKEQGRGGEESNVM